jgi:hypothetical protein
MLHARLPLATTLSLFALAHLLAAQTPDENIALLCPAGVPGDLPVIAGTVRDATTQQPVANARILVSAPSSPDFVPSWVRLDETAGFVRSDSAGTYALCSVPLGARIALYASHGDRQSKFVALFLLSGGVSTGADFHPMETRIWRQDLDLLPREQQTAGLIGQVTDPAGAPVAQAEVSLIGSPHMARTDATGRFSFGRLPPGSVRLRVVRLGFRPMERDIELVAGDTVDLSASALENIPIRLAEVAVTAEALSERLQEVGFLDRSRASANGSFQTMEDYRRRRGEPVFTTEVLNTMRGLRVRSMVVTAGLAYPAVVFPRCGNSPPAYFVDGMFIGTGADTDINFLVPTEWLEAVEAYPDARFVAIGRRPPSGCGAIYFWTKRLEQEPAEDTPVEPGARVRVTAPAEGLRNYVATYLAGNRDTVYVQGEAGAAQLAISVAAVSRLELRSGRKNRRLLGTGIGFLTGTALGAASGIINDDRAMSALVLAVPGSFVGLIVGSVLKTDRWEEAVPAHILVGGLWQREARVRLAVSFSF